MAITTGAVLERVRTEAGLTQRQLAERAGTAQSLVARIEGDQANPTIETLSRLLDAAGFVLTIGAERKLAPDPLVEAFKKDIDRSLLRENLRKTPQQRVATLVAMSRFRDEANRARASRPR